MKPIEWIRWLPQTQDPSRGKQPRLEPGGEGMKFERETNLVPPMLSCTRTDREPAAPC